MIHKLDSGLEFKITQPPVARFAKTVPENLQSTLPQIEDLEQELKELDHEN
ncbi:MAG: hypothetical protein ABI851_15355 [Saprospiraceae bacterium]